MSKRDNTYYEADPEEEAVDNLPNIKGKTLSVAINVRNIRI